jgi:hypothetical protein
MKLEPAIETIGSRIFGRLAFKTRPLIKNAITGSNSPKKMRRSIKHIAKQIPGGAMLNRLLTPETDRVRTRSRMGMSRDASTARPYTQHTNFTR